MARPDWVRAGLVGWSIAGLLLSCGQVIEDELPRPTHGPRGGAAGAAGAAGATPSNEEARAGDASGGAGATTSDEHAGDASVITSEAGTGGLVDRPGREGLGSGGEAGTGTAGEGGGGAPATPLRGQRNGRPLMGESCAIDADCGDDGLRCLGANEDYDEGSGAPANGICTAACTTDSACRIFDQAAICATLDEAPLMGGLAEEPALRFCMLGCSLGAPSGNSKCHGRLDLACRPFAPPDSEECSKKAPCREGTFCYRGQCRAAACGPRCNSDLECAAGRHCDPLWGLCTTEVPEYTPIGAECMTEGSDDSVCGYGVCLYVTAEQIIEGEPRQVRVKEMCTQPCTLGTVCGEGTGACVSPRLPDYGPGDVGYCLQKCDCDADCLNSGDRCRALTPDNVERYGSPGVCDYIPEGSPSIDCASGENGGSGGEGGRGN